MFKRTFRPFFFYLILTLSAAGFVEAQSSGDGVWTEIGERSTPMLAAERSIYPETYKTFRVNKSALRLILDEAPEVSDPSGMSGATLTFPMPDGSFERFRIEHSLTVEPGLLEKFPELGQTYRGQGIDDPTATVRFDFLPSGFHSMILSTRGTVMVDPYAKGDTSNYISYFKRDIRRSSEFECEFDVQDDIEVIISPKDRGFHEIIPDIARPEISSGAQLRTYRLAVAATGEYTAAAGGGTVAGALDAQVSIMNRVNGVYERDLALRMIIIANNNLIVYTNGATDPYTNEDGSAMLGQNQNNLNTVITHANYDIGHVFSTGGGGVATLAGPCGANKARGVTGLPNPTGDVFAIDFVAHELGHQWGALHTFNGGSGSCGRLGTRSSGSAFEPGSGVTIMGYAGICGPQNLARNSIDSFHVKSLEEIMAYSQNGTGNSCAALTNTLNAAPSVVSVGGSSFNIPKQTPFTLTASGSDVDGDSITYDWQQYDLGPGTSEVPNADSDGAARPLFRVFAPTSNPSRTFPSLQYILANSNVPPGSEDGFLIGELLPEITRTMNFRVIGRDNRANGGGINTAAVTVDVSGTIGPFRVSSQNTNNTWYLNSQQNITWDVSDSNEAPVNTANVKISLSIDGGQTFPVVLAAYTPNDGSETINSPVLDTNQARIKVEAVDNIFFDISDANFTVVSTPTVDGPIAGRVVTASGIGVPRIYVMLTGGNPSITRQALTNAFGYYSFDSVPFAQSYTITPQKRKRYAFLPASILRNHTSDAVDANFTAVLAFQ